MDWFSIEEGEIYLHNGKLVEVQLKGITPGQVQVVSEDDRLYWVNPKFLSN